MNILIVGPTGSGKSKLGDLIRNTIFKLDSNSKIVTVDPDRDIKDFGEGSNVYNIEVEKVANLADVTIDTMRDVIIILPTGAINQWFKDVYES